MKNKILLIFVAILTLLLPACSWFGSSSEALSLKFFVSDSSVPEKYYAEASLTIVPDYELRTLAVTYALIFPNRIEKTDIQDIDSEGVIGGEYFERFERIINTLKTDLLVSELDDDVLKKFLVTVEKKGGIFEEYDLNRISDKDMTELLSNYYLDITELFTEEVY